jgi:filamentous hemagglutinin family protein
MKNFYFQVCLLSGNFLLFLLTPNFAVAQIVRDNTLPTSSVVTLKDNIIEINGGTRSGNNLFHSFEQFSVSKDTTAFFKNALDIQNIFSRVTGIERSQIDGIIKTQGTANLFLINPNGITFGEHASLNIGGSFFATTADRIIFAKGGEFSAINPQEKTILTVTAPIGLGFGKMPGSIVNRSVALSINPLNGELEPSGLQVQSGKTLALVGGDINIEKGGILSTLNGQIELGSVADNNVVGLLPTESGWTLGYEDIKDFQDISLSEGASVGTNTTNNTGGDIRLRGRHISFTEGSQVFSLSFAQGIVGNVRVNASETVELVGTSRANPTSLSAEVDENATGKGKSLTINTRRLIVRDGGLVSTGTFGVGRAANLNVNAFDSVEILGGSINGSSAILASVAPLATGDGGTLTINTRQLIVKDGAQVSTVTYGAGDAGDIKINASELVRLEGTALDKITPSGLSTQVNKPFPGIANILPPELLELAIPTGNAGDLNVETKQLIVLNGAQISSAARNIGQGGNINIKADFIQLSGTAPKANLEEGSSGIFVSAEKPYEFPEGLGKFIFTTANAGDLDIKTGKLIVENGARISGDTFGTGDGGKVTLDVRQLTIQTGGQLGAGSRVEANPRNRERGDGGTLTVNASESVEVNGTGKIGDRTVNSSLFTEAQGTGDAGNLTINTPLLTVRNGAQVTVSAEGTGEAGSLTVDSNSILLNDGSLEATTKTGDQGNITLNANDIILRRDSNITTNATEAATGGNITINTDILAALENSDITANAVEGRGGNIQIDTQGIFLSPDSEITASSDRGIDGTVIITTPEVDPTAGVLELPSSPVDAESLIAKDVCRIEDGKIARGSSFIITGKGGLPPTSEDPLINSHRMVEWETVAEERGNSTVTLRQRPQTDERGEKTYPVIQQAQGWKIASDGTLLLTAQATTPTPQSSEGVSPHCQGNNSR